MIASSPTDIQPVLDVVAENAARLCEATDARFASLRATATNWWRHLELCLPRNLELRAQKTLSAGRFLREKQLIFTIFRTSLVGPSSSGTRTPLSTPMLREGAPIGLINIRRTEVRPFSERQIKLLETFAAQAVIAIENVRLFQELEARTSELARSVGELRALGEVSQAVSSTLDLETVLATIVSHAVQLSGTDCGVIYEYDETTEEFDLRASHRMEDRSGRDAAGGTDPPGRGHHRSSGDDAVRPFQVSDIFQ